MKNSIDNHSLRDALLARDFKDITSETRSTKSRCLHHPDMAHAVFLKLATKPTQRMSTYPLVIHPEDALKIEAAAGSLKGVHVAAAPYRGSSTKYSGVAGRAVSIETLAALDALLDRLMPSQSTVTSDDQDDLTEMDSLILQAATAEIDAAFAGTTLPATTRMALIEARVGQGKFRKDMMRVWDGTCALTGCGVKPALVASHAVAWRDNKDPNVCLDPHNGLLLVASVDRLFDKGLISFDDSGHMLVKPSLSDTDLDCLGLSRNARLRTLPKEVRPYLQAHRQRFGF